MKRGLRRPAAETGPYTTADLRRPGQGVYGWIDDVSEWSIDGWAVSGDPHEAVVALELLHDKEVLARCFTEEQRLDISQALGRPVRAGFRLDLGRLARERRDRVAELSNQPLQLRVVGTDRFVGPGPLVLDEHIIASLLRRSEGPLAAISSSRSFVAERVRTMPKPSQPADLRCLAFYLPQFHPVDANDEWWGEGFTEWSNVAQARSLFSEHEQPRVPTALGYYDLMAPRTLSRQAELAKQYGIHGFCFYSYSFEGERLLADPVSALMSRPDIDLPFCLCWANENWTRRWDGDHSEVLVSQRHDIDADAAYLDHVLEAFADPRYITVDGRPVLLVYRPGLLPDARTVTALWREQARAAGYPDLYLVMAQTFGTLDPRDHGFDAAVEFPPHSFPAEEITDDVVDESDGFKGKIYDYPSLVAGALSRPAPEYVLHRTVMPSWDNTPRKGVEGHVYHGSTPALYQAWLRHAAEETAKTTSGDAALVFVNAWNEWAEGAHLEPDNVHGTTYLEATRAALSGRDSPEAALELLSRDDVPAERASELVRALISGYRALEQSNSALVSLVRAQQEHVPAARFRRGLPGHLAGLGRGRAPQAWIDHLGHNTSLVSATALQGSRLQVSGWSFCPGLAQTRETVSLLLLRPAAGGELWCAYLHQRLARYDVAESLSPVHPETETVFSGFRALLDFEDVPPGRYELAISYPADGALHTAYLDGHLDVG